jgi:hypothetical protein
VTEQYVEIFQEYLKRILGHAVRVCVRTGGRKGETVKTLVLDFAPKERLDRILSEGEQRAVALADFLTEARLNHDCVGLVFDDPVTSLAFEWREEAAKMLVEEAKRKQVLIFTHDLSFLYWLHEAADSSQIVRQTHWMMRDDEDNPGMIALESGPALEQDYRTAERAMNCHRKAKETRSMEDRAMFLKHGFTTLRTSYEALILFDLLKGCVVRFNERFSMERFKTITWDQDSVEKLQSRYFELCKYMEGHLHSDNQGNSLAALNKLDEEIQAFLEIRSCLKKKKELGSSKAPIGLAISVMPEESRSKSS